MSEFRCSHCGLLGCGDKYCLKCTEKKIKWAKKEERREIWKWIYDNYDEGDEVLPRELADRICPKEERNEE